MSNPIIVGYRKSISLLEQDETPNRKYRGILAFSFIRAIEQFWYYNSLDQSFLKQQKPEDIEVAYKVFQRLDKFYA